MQDRPLAYRLIGFLTDEYCIADLRRELDDGLNLFQVSRVKYHFNGLMRIPIVYR